ncbi:MAG: tRNA (guanosine(37)-N1)-methyltransferase TrmD [Xanthomonadaceae bacterium]|nr:tRNA (guanosine(37)-N1)-methyltransferase TrmD [Xanthomonadaceae bacterium]
MSFKISVLTLFPEVFRETLSASLIGKAIKNQHLDIEIIQIRDSATDRHRSVDDTPYGGGEGMLMRADVLYNAWKSMVPEKSGAVKTIMLSPQGTLLTQEIAKSWMIPVPQFEHLVLVCGHYEGVDERFIELCVDQEISVGDYVCTGGEFPALILIDVLSRLIPGVVKNPDSVSNDSFEGGLLKYPQYTKPQTFKGLSVPEVLLSGDHAKIATFRAEESRKRTKKKRPDL